ncbi:hypothetical protein GCM10010954_21710 [Halobacillus andaensis]|uniref:Uncharacterized protein n=2 Tax=Halobacillus andaensis TaxID=1176239 RepID=A0A917B633_HALAA|nr:hypothetical protein GCM10010954_21710 [Halobacillus andaensis]
MFISVAGLVIMVLAMIFQSHESAGNPTAKEIVSENPDADILKLDGLIYTNVSDREWIKDNDYTKNKAIGEVKKQTTNTWWYRNLYASKLPKGTKIYSVNDREYSKGDAPAFIMVEKNDEEAIYQSLVEG